jgi:hypothetical protein
MESSISRVSPASSRLPIEILQEIYHLLSPPDFDAARHTCRLWLFASLDKTLLASQLSIGGWRAGAEQDLLEASAHFQTKRHGSSGSAYEGNSTTVSQAVSAEWILSKRLAAETRYCADWRPIWPSESSNGTRGVDHMVAVCAMTPPAVQTPPLRDARAPTLPSTFTVSGCSKFALLVQDRVVFIYSLQSFKAGMRAMTSILCHRRVVNVSMDTSCGRYAVGILLEGRTGICCVLDMDHSDSPTMNRIHSSMSLSDFRNMEVSTTSRRRPLCSGQDQFDFDLSSPTRSRLPPRAESYRRRGHPLGRSDDVTLVRGNSSLRLTDSNSHAGYGEEFNPQIPNPSFPRFFPERSMDEHATDPITQQYPINNLDPMTRTSVPIELGARKVYKNLCSIQDPPTSVAICPQRQCVAFGCKTGVELHWIDALRGSTLSRYMPALCYQYTTAAQLTVACLRWFPLAAPSDYLYFVPPRDGEQRTSNTKLRLISSAGGAAEFVDADHYRAVPLSDGHILFTDPESGHLYLGSDQPGGPTKLQREFVFLPPSEQGAGKAADCYAAGHELRWGVRIVVAYGRTVMLYNLPPDDFQRARPTTPGFQVAQSDLAMDVAVDDGPRRPRRLEGVHIHFVDEGVVQDIAVDTRLGGLKVWLFLRGEEGRRRATWKGGVHLGWLSSPNLALRHHS